MPHGTQFATVNFKAGDSGCFLYLAGADACRANTHLLPHPGHYRAHALQVWIPPAPPRVVCVADHVSIVRRFAAELTLQCHFSSCFSFYLGLDFLLEMSLNQAPYSSRPSTPGKARCLRRLRLGWSLQDTVLASRMFLRGAPFVPPDGFRGALVPWVRIA
jgi:hypothetical protein